jgi:hypothetical protein
MGVRVRKPGFGAPCGIAEVTQPALPLIPKSVKKQLDEMVYEVSRTDALNPLINVLRMY